MKKIVLLFTLIISSNLHALTILHISAHRGCIQEFERVAQELSLNLTSWFVFDPQIFSQLSTDAQPNYNIFNMTHDKAEYIWRNNKQYFDQFDTIITSDTAPLSRIFLQNEWNKPLIIWICNRFDYHHEISANIFPDPEYYDLMREAALNPNVFIASYTPYEYRYAYEKNVNIGKLVIKPIGSLPQQIQTSNFPADFDRSQRIFLSQTGPAPLHKEQKSKVEYITNQCLQRGIRVCHGYYNGPDDLTGIKGVLHFPYQASNLFLFENIQRGIIHFVPSEKFLAMAKESDEPNMPCTGTKYWLDSFENSEWYLLENRDLFVYFDSWDDLADKVVNLDYDAKQKQVRELGKQHRTTMLARWKRIFSQITSMRTHK